MSRVSFGKVGVDGDLNQAIAVAQIEEDQPAVIATTMYPAGQGYLLTSM